MSQKITPQKIESMRNDLAQIRQASLRASRNGDFMRVARLSTQTAQINKSILEGESQLLAEL